MLNAMFQGGRDVHPTELPGGFRERFDKEAANMGRATLSFSDSWIDGIDGIGGFHQVPWHEMQFARNSRGSFFVVSWHVHLSVCMNDFIYTCLGLGPVAFGATKLILKGKVTSQVTAESWVKYSIYQMMPQVVGGCIWAALAHERSQNATVCRSLGHS